MSEKDGRRVLSPAEKAEADSLTNKQWLDTIGGPTGSRRTRAASMQRLRAMVNRYASGLPSRGERPLRTKRRNASCATSGASS